MKELRDIGHFPFDIRQLPNYCIPANVASINKYLNSDSNLTQQDIMNEFDRRKPSTAGLSLESVKNYAILGNPEFAWADPKYISGKFEPIVQEVKSSIDSDLPHIISVNGGRVGNVQLFHMLTVVGYDDSSFKVHDTETPAWGQNPRDVPLSRIRLGLMQVHLSQGRIGDDSTDSLVIRRH